MKIFGFNTKSEKYFINVTCNIILGLIIIAVFSLSMFMPVSSQVSLNKTSAIYNGNKSSNNVSLMFNVYWGTEYLEDILNVLNLEQVEATFFVGGSWVAKNNEMLKKIYSSGQEIANHGYNHKDHSKLTSQQNKNEIYVTHELVKSILGLEMNLFAPPSGSYNNNTLAVATSLGYRTIMWSKDTIDWRDKNETQIYTRATNNVVGGDLILMHPTEHTLKALNNIISTIKNKGLNLVSVSKNLA